MQPRFQYLFTTFCHLTLPVERPTRREWVQHTLFAGEAQAQEGRASLPVLRAVVYTPTSQWTPRHAGSGGIREVGCPCPNQQECVPPCPWGSPPVSHGRSRHPSLPSHRMQDHDLPAQVVMRVSRFSSFLCNLLSGKVVYRPGTGNRSHEGCDPLLDGDACSAISLLPVPARGIASWYD